MNAPSEEPPKTTAAVKRVIKDPIGDKELASNLIWMKNTTDQSAILMAVAYLDHALQLALTRRFRKLRKNDLAKTFRPDQGGFLSATQPKIVLCYALGIIGPNTYHDLSLLNDVRNTFAHTLRRVDFTHPDVIADCNNLKLCHWALDDNIKVPLINPKDRFCHTAFHIYLWLSDVSADDDQRSSDEVIPTYSTLLAPRKRAHGRAP